MRAKVTLTRNFGITTSTNNYGLPILTLRVMQENKAIVREI